MSLALSTLFSFRHKVFVLYLKNMPFLAKVLFKCLSIILGLLKKEFLNPAQPYTLLSL